MYNIVVCTIVTSYWWCVLLRMCVVLYSILCHHVCFFPLLQPHILHWYSKTTKEQEKSCNPWYTYNAITTTTITTTVHSSLVVHT